MTLNDHYWESVACLLEKEPQQLARSIFKGRSAVIQAGAPYLDMQTIPKDAPFSFGAVLKLCRPHQWSKNSLVFVALIIGGTPTLETLSLLGLVFLLMSALASGTYIINDIFDLSSDRKNPFKSHRPLANRQVSIPFALFLALGLISLSLVLGFALMPNLGYGLIFYLTLTLSYTFWLKGLFLLDVIVLAMLFTFRVVFGAVILAIPMSSWFIAFVLISFLSLAFVKRVTELKEVQSSGNAVNERRKYQLEHLSLLIWLGMGTAMGSVGIFAAFIVLDPHVLARYSQVEMLWLSAAFYALWIGYIWLKTLKGQMHTDPIVFSGTNIISLWLVASVIGTHILSRWPQ